MHLNAFFRWIPAVLTLTLIFILSSVPGQAIQSSGLGSETIHINGHFIMFFLLCICFYYAVYSIKSAAVMSFVYAVFDEIHQMYTPLRSASLFDVFVDSIGILLAVLFLWKIYPTIQKILKVSQ